MARDSLIGLKMRVRRRTMTYDYDGLGISNETSIHIM